MATRYIYLSNDLNEKLKKEENASRLIQRLLIEYYKFNVTSLDEVNTKIDQIKENLSTEVNDVSTELQKLERLKMKIEDQEQIRKDEEERKARKAKEFKDKAMEIYKEETGVEMTEDEFNRFKELFLKKEVNSIYEFIEGVKQI